MNLDELRQHADDLAASAKWLADQLRAYQPPPPPPPPPTVAPVEYALFCYNDPAIDGRRTIQTLQGQPGTVSLLPQLRQAGVKKLYRYSWAVTWTDHPDAAVRMGSDPATFNRAWLATRGGQLIRSTKFDSGSGYGNYLIDVGNTDYQKASADWLIKLCRTHGWDGVYLDEINEYVAYAGYLVPTKYGTDAQFQQAQLAYIRYVAAALESAGFECHVNLAANDTPWRTDVVAAVDGTHIEFFMVQYTVNSPGAWHVASMENGEFKRQLNWLAWNEAAGKTTTCQADARTEAEVNYALASMLLVARKARFAARKNSSYGVGQGWWAAAMDTAKLLGKPLGSYTVAASGLHQREFDKGRVTVNPTTKPINTVPAMSGVIELRVA